MEARPSLCPDCGAPVSGEAWAAGLCLPCLAELAVLDSVAEAEVDEVLHEAPTLESDGAPTLESDGACLDDATLVAGEPAAGSSPAGVSPGAVLGERYRLRSHLGSGGMGEVWRAFDLKLRVDVALKSLRCELIRDSQALEMLRQEVRVAREVISPNVCRVFDLQEVGEQEWISMEYVDGTTLQEIVRSRGPLALDEAREIASQFLAGLEAIHEAGLVHRDVKPENLMVTRAGRVVVMDFGIAKSLEEGEGGVISGTPAYMSPEQMRGEALDARADVYAAGVVLAEMVAPGGAGTLAERKAIWEEIHTAEPRIAETPWAGLIGQAVAPRREGRPASAAVLARALEEVTLRAAGDEDLDPYPGLSAFTEERSSYFFGRELEVEGLWKRLRRPQLRALIAPSGAGKSSFLRAGVLATLPEGWRAIVATPGRRPFAALQAAVASDGEAAVAAPGAFGDTQAAVAGVAAWRAECDHALVVVDQFEELFTQNDAETQEAFAELLGRLPLDADVHVLLAMREDFHFHCQRFEALAPAFSDTMPLGSLGGSALRRALVQPALKCGYRFEDDSLVDEMLAEVAHERGALPLLAFAAAQLWERRDREKGLLTRAAYQEIGGVGGALGRHAEATLERIGPDREPIVRELFRNLVTAQGTRVARGRDELLSVFDDRDVESAGEVLDTLVDARLLTTYEEAGGEGEAASRRLEVVHESLLAKWPRLVRWRAQDAEGAQLRDDLRQTAQRWRERDRPDDLLWAGTSFKEFELWRERYPGGLTSEEEEFARAMKTRAERAKHRRRLAVGAAFAVLLVVLAVVGGFWRRAVTEGDRAEAQKLLALGQLELEGFSTATLAYATRSIAVSDSREGRELALEALWRGPPAWQVVPEGGLGTLFSPDDGWLAQGRLLRVPNAAELPKVQLHSRDGSSRLLERIYDQQGAGLLAWLSPDLFLTRSFRQGAGSTGVVFDYGIWSAGQGRAVGRAFGIPMWPSQLDYVGWDGPASRLVVPLPGGEVRSYGLGEAEGTSAGSIAAIGAAQQVAVSPAGRWIATATGGDIIVHPLLDGRLQEEQALGRHEGLTSMAAGPFGTDLLVTRSDSGEVKIWRPASEAPAKVIQGPAGPGGAQLPGDGSILLLAVRDPEVPGAARLWVGPWENPDPRLRSLGSHTFGDADIALDPGGRQAVLPGQSLFWARLDAPVDTKPVELQTGLDATFRGVDFDSEGRWLVGASAGTFLWSLERPYPFVIERSAGRPVFDPGGRWLLSRGVAEDGSGTIEKWDLGEGGAWARTEIWRRRTRGYIANLAVSPDGSRVLIGHRFFSEGPLLLSLGDGSAEPLPEGFEDESFGSLSRDGRYAAASGGQFLENENRVKVWDLDRRELVATLAPEESIAHCGAAFTPENDLLWASTESGLWRWSFETDENELVYQGAVGEFWPDAEVRRVLMRLHDDEALTRKLVWLDLESGETVELASHGENVAAAALGPEGRIVASVGTDLVVRVGLADGGEPHLLYRAPSRVFQIVVDPLRRWVVTSSADELRFWPIPDLERTPAQALPKEELLKLLEAQTNLRLVESPEDSTGWSLEWGPFPGWRESPPRW